MRNNSKERAKNGSRSMAVINGEIVDEEMLNAMASASDLASNDIAERHKKQKSSNIP